MRSKQINKILNTLSDSYAKLGCERGVPIDRIVCPAGMRSMHYESVLRKIARSEASLSRYLGDGLDMFEGKEKASGLD